MESRDVPPRPGAAVRRSGVAGTAVLQRRGRMTGSWDRRVGSVRHPLYSPRPCPGAEIRRCVAPRGGRSRFGVDNVLYGVGECEDSWLTKPRRYVEAATRRARCRPPTRDSRRSPSVPARNDASTRSASARPAGSPPKRCARGLRGWPTSDPSPPAVEASGRPLLARTRARGNRAPGGGRIAVVSTAAHATPARRASPAAPPGRPDLSVAAHGSGYLLSSRPGAQPRREYGADIDASSRQRDATRKRC